MAESLGPCFKQVKYFSDYYPRRLFYNTLNFIRLRKLKRTDSVRHYHIPSRRVSLKVDISRVGDTAVPLGDGDTGLSVKLEFSRTTRFTNLDRLREPLPRLGIWSSRSFPSFRSRAERQ